MRAQLFFNPWESKAFLAKYILKEISIQSALEKGIIVVGLGTTNAFVLHELLIATNHQDFAVDFNAYAAGVIGKHVCVTESSKRSREVIFRDGVPEFKSIAEIIDTMGSNDVIIKGANVLGADMIPGVLLANPKGGTVGLTYAPAIAKGIKIIVPISLAKSIPYPLVDIIPLLGGQQNINFARGTPVGLFPLIGSQVFSEFEAIQNCGNVEVVPLAVNGLNEGAGGLLLEIEGENEEVNNVITCYKSILGTLPLDIPFKNCKDCKIEICIEKHQ